MGPREIPRRGRHLLARGQIQRGRIFPSTPALRCGLAPEDPMERYVQPTGDGKGLFNSPRGAPCGLSPCTARRAMWSTRPQAPPAVDPGPRSPWVEAAPGEVYLVGIDVDSGRSSYSHPEDAGVRGRRGGRPRRDLDDRGAAETAETCPPCLR